MTNDGVEGQKLKTRSKTCGVCVNSLKPSQHDYPWYQG